MVASNPVKWSPLRPVFQAVEYRRPELGVLIFSNPHAQNIFPAIQIAVSQFRQKNEIVHRIKDMEREMAARKIIDRAKGLLMDFYHISEDEAYRRMQQTSMKRGIALSEVAQKVVKEIMARKNK